MANKSYNAISDSDADIGGVDAWFEFKFIENVLSEGDIVCDLVLSAFLDL